MKIIPFLLVTTAVLFSVVDNAIAQTSVEIRSISQTTTDDKDVQSQLAKLNQQIDLKPQDAWAYYYRGDWKAYKLNDRTGGIADVRTAADLAASQNDTKVLSEAQKLLQSWSVK